MDRTPMLPNGGQQKAQGAHGERQSLESFAVTKLPPSLLGRLVAVCATGTITVPYYYALTALVAAALLLWYLVAARTWRSTYSIAIESLLSVDERPGSDIVKLDELGRWQLFEGLSVVLPVLTERYPAFSQLFNRVATDYHTLLSGNPLSSYHVTLCSIVLRRDMSRSAYNELVSRSRPSLERLKARLAEETRPVIFNFSGVWWNPAGISIDLQPATDADYTTLRHYESLAADCLGALYVRMDRYHMGFSYIVQERANDSSPELTELVTGLHTLFAGVEFVAAVPQLVAFSTMLRFNPV